MLVPHPGPAGKGCCRPDGGYLAGLACGFYNGYEDILNSHKEAKRYSPMMEKEEAESLYEGWVEAVKATRAYKPRR